MKFTLEGIEVDLVKSALEVWKEEIERSLKNTPPVIDDRIEPVYEEMKRDCLKRIEKLLEEYPESQEGCQHVLERVEHRDCLSIPNDEFLDRTDEEIIHLIDISFHKIESEDIPVGKMLISPEIEKRLLPLKTRDVKIYDKKEEEESIEVYDIHCKGYCGHLWTAAVQVVEGLNDVVFLSSDKEYLDFYTDAKRIL